MTSNVPQFCPIWGEEFPTLVRRYPQEGITEVLNSPRAGGAYHLFDDADQEVGNLPDEQKAILTTWLIDQRQQGADWPRVTEGILGYIKTKPSLPEPERSDRLLRFIAEQSKPIGTRVQVNFSEPEVLAWSESTSPQEVYPLLRYLKGKGWLEGNFYLGGSFSGEVTVDGFGHIAEQAANADLDQVFVAMWFHEDMTKIYDAGIEPAIKESGYNPYRVDREEYIGKIDDQIIAEIRRSKFLVADFTHGENGVRGGVYYEAGFAHGLNLPVIFMCKKGPVDSDPNYLHFDTNHYNHILWTDAADLKEKLKNRILAVIGQGPVLPNQ